MEVRYLPKQIMQGDGRFRTSKRRRRRSTIDLHLERQVKLRGWVVGSELTRAFLSADIFVLPSYTEGLPNALLQAMASSLPVIVTPVGSIPSVVEPGTNGLLVPVGDVKALTAAMESLAKDLIRAKRMGECNRAKILQNYDLDIVWKKVAHVLEVEVA